MATKLKYLVLIITLLSTSAFSEEIQEVIILEKKLSSLNGWSSNQSISFINQEELNKLSQQFKNFRWINILEHEDEMRTADYIGRPTESMVHSILERSNVNALTHYFICGPDPMMKIIQSGLDQFGVQSEQIQIERFVRNYLTENLEGSNEINISIVLDGTTHELKIDRDQPILDQALLAGIDMPYSCKSGFCTACRGKVLSGKVDTKEADGLSEEEIAEGFALLCVGCALTPELKLSIE